MDGLGIRSRTSVGGWQDSRRRIDAVIVQHFGGDGHFAAERPDKRLGGSNLQSRDLGSA